MTVNHSYKSHPVISNMWTTWWFQPWSRGTDDVMLITLSCCATALLIPSNPLKPEELCQPGWICPAQSLLWLGTSRAVAGIYLWPVQDPSRSSRFCCALRVVRSWARLSWRRCEWGRGALAGRDQHHHFHLFISCCPPHFLYTPFSLQSII